MAGPRGSHTSSGLSSRPSSSGSPTTSSCRKASTSQFSSSTSSSSSFTPHSAVTGTSPRVQLVPHVHRLSHDCTLSQCEKEVLDGTSFDAFDLSSKDFDFEDIFTYGRPQKRSSSAVEASSPQHREKDWSGFAYSHYAPATSLRHKVNRSRNGAGEMYVKNQSNARKR